MAPMRKRPRANEDDDEIIAVESASSSLRHDVRKRARISVNQPSKTIQQDDGDSDASSDSDSELPDAPDDNAPPATQYEIIRDNGFKHLANPDLDDEIATQRLKRRQENQKLLGENRPAENAIIESITCINFMCHDKLFVELGPLINFVVGNNGSGKSAVLTALTLCLGGKAAATNRGASLKDLIKEGRDQALLIIKLKNGGNDAYQPEVFGDTIIVERYFSRTGGSSFKLKTETGRTISTKRGDVDDVVEFYQLQVDNPMNVLTQDAAKSFITASTPRQKYIFFTKGVQLDTLDRDYKIISDQCDVISAKLVQNEEDLKVLEQQAKDSKKKHEASQQNEGLRERAKVVQRKLVWSQILALENELTERENKVGEGQRATEDAERDAEEKSQALDTIDQTLQRLRDTERQLQDEAIPLRREEESAKDAHDEASKEVQDIHQESKNVVTEMKGAQKEVSNFKKSITEEEKKLEEANGGSHARKQAEIEEAERLQDEAQETVKEHDTHLPEVTSKKEEAERSLGEVQHRLEAKRSESRREKQALDDLNRSRGESMAGIHPNLPKLQQLIRGDNGFLEKPIGPLGSCIRLKDGSWSHILEKTFGGALNGFVVTSKSDEKRLARLIGQSGMPRNTPISILDHQSLRQLNEPDEQFLTTLRVLEFDNELVKKALIINNRIEQTILVGKRAEAVNVMFSGPRPRNVKACFCFHDKIRGHGWSLGYGPNNGQAMDPIKPFEGRPRMATDIESRVNYQRDTVRLVDQQLDALETEKRQAHSKVQECTNAITQHKRDRQNLTIEVQRAGAAVDTLTAELTAMGVKTGRLEGLKEELKEAEKRLKTLGDTYGNNGVEKEKLNQISIDKIRELKAVKLRVQEHDTKLKKQHDKIRNNEQIRLMALQEKNLAFNNIEAARAEKKILEKKRHAAATKLVEDTAEAHKYADRVYLERGETHAGLEVQYQKIRETLRTRDKKNGATAQQINEAYIVAQTAFDSAKNTLEELQQLLAVLKQAFMMRIEMFQRFQRHISSSSRMAFLYLLAERAFRGKLVIDHQAKMLDVNVEPDETNKSGKGRQTKGLSGGEKSFTSVCVLLALWEAMSAPLRCLDEFDVFMDDVNRDVSTRMIITAARRSVGRQFILITPKALGEGVADKAKDVNIIKLLDPRDPQRRIDEMMQD